MVDVSSQNNSVSINVSSSGNSASINATPDMAMYYSEKAREWAISDRIVDGVDYSSKYYAEQSNQSALNAQSFAQSAQDSYNNVQNSAVKALEDIEKDKTFAINSVTTAKNSAISDIDITAKSYDNLTNRQITNCLLEVPQRINLTLSAGTLTLKKGSIVTVPYGTTNRTAEFPVGSQFLNSNWKVVSTQFADNKFFVWAELQQDISKNRTDLDGKDRFISVYLDGTINGATSSQSGTSFSNGLGYNTSKNTVYWYNTSGVAQGTQLAFPIGIVACSDTYTFGSIKQVFNGMGYVGRTLWLDKGVKVLIGTGRNADGTIKNTEITTKLLIKASHNYTEDRLLLYKKSGGLEDILPKRYLTGLKKDMPTTLSEAVLHNYFCTDTMETYWTTGSTTVNWQRAEDKTPIAVYGATAEAGGKTITFLNPYQAFRAVDWGEFNEKLSQKADKVEVLNKSQITNCLLEVPQRIKLELNNGTLTLKAGSVVIVPYGTENLTSQFPVGATFLNNNFKVYDTQFADGKFFVWAELANDLSNSRTTTDTSQRMLIVYIESKGGSYPDGATRNASGTSTSSSTLFYNTSTNKVEYLNNGVNTTNSLASLPIGLCKADGVNVYASIDQVFNGFGYIGSTIWVDKGVNGLIPNGRNEDGTLKNTQFTNLTLRTVTLSAYTNSNLPMQVNSSQVGWSDKLYIQEENPNDNYSHWYQPSTNILYYTGSSVTSCNPVQHLIFGFLDRTNGIVSGWRPYQTFRAVDYNDKREITTWGFPSSKYTVLTMGANNSTYTAPANGYFSICGEAIANGGAYVALANEANRLRTKSNTDGYAGTDCNVFIPVKQGDVVKLQYINFHLKESYQQFVFIYAEGDK